MRWIGLWICVAAAIGCRGLSAGAEPGETSPGLTGPAAGADPGDRADAGPGDRGAAAAADAGPADAGAIGTATADGGDAGAIGTATADGGDASLPLCPPPGASDPAAEVPTSGWSPPTAVPFSCAPMPNAFFFPSPGPDVSGVYARCASFADARASSLVVDRDGSRVALIGIDGVARIVDVASRMVVGVLAPPRASVGLAAFSPSGGTILTVARGERQVTLWRVDTFAPIWTTTLPGHTYQDASRPAGVCTCSTSRRGQSAPRAPGAAASFSVPATAGRGAGSRCSPRPSTGCACTRLTAGRSRSSTRTRSCRS